MLEAHSIWTSLGEVLSKFIIWTAKVFLLGLTGLETRAQIQFHFGFLITTGINGLTGTSGRASQLCRKWWTRILVFLHPMRNVIHLQTFGILCHFSSSLNHHHLPTSDHTLAQNFPTCQPEIDGFIWWKSPLLLEYLPLAKNKLSNSNIHSHTLINEGDNFKSIKIYWVGLAVSCLMLPHSSPFHSYTHILWWWPFNVPLIKVDELEAWEDVTPCWLVGAGSVISRERRVVNVKRNMT